jgi:hemolysin III
MARVWTEENAAQESVNAWTHGLGFIASIPCGFALCWYAAGRSQQLLVACAVYSMSLSAMYLFSMLSHSVREPRGRTSIRAIDQGTIYLLIAGTFTPFAWGALDGWIRALFLSLVWTAAVAGFYSKVFARHRVNNMTAVSYVLLGWLPSMVLFLYVPIACFGIMALGGLMYTVGTLFLQNDHRFWFFHAIWHTLVILASACHYAAIAAFIVKA